jgi:hypothetical protein
VDANRFGSLARILTPTGSRRRALATGFGSVLGIVLGAASVEVPAAKKKKPCPPCKKRKQGRCKKQLPDGTACQSGTCQGGSCVATTCPAVCPVCQTCNSASGSCAVDTSENGEAGAGCAAPKVCCSGTCCSGVHACNVASSCATCAEVCDANCAFCSNLAQGGTRCGGLPDMDCTSPCSSSAQCTADFPTCVESVTNWNSNQTSFLCDADSATGFCVSIPPCT